MDATSVFNIASLSWLSVQAVPLVLWPRFVASLLETAPADAGSVTYFARALGLAQLALALQGLVLSGLLPLSEPGLSSGYAWAAALTTTLYHSAAAFYSYGCYYSYDTQSYVTAYLFGCFGSASLAACGLWCLMFGDASGHSSHISRRTGADKRTSGFPFKNSVADKRK